MTLWLSLPVGFAAFVASSVLILAGAALNVLAGFSLERGDLELAQRRYRMAIELGGADADLKGRVEQNLGIIANVHGDWHEARRHYERSLSAFLAAGDERGCLLAAERFERAVRFRVGLCAGRCLLCFCHVYAPSLTGCWLLGRHRFGGIRLSRFHMRDYQLGDLG